MNINQEQRTATRKKIIEAAVGVIIEKGLKGATMREIAKQAGIGDATIYNYFPTKEAIVYGYYEDRLETAAGQINAIQGFGDYTFQEQLQSFLETMLTGLLADREFVQVTFHKAFFTMGQNQGRLKPLRKQFIITVKQMFQSAEEKGEIPELVFGDIPVQLFWDYFLAMIAYWLKDQSDQFANTTVLMDLSLDMTCAVLKSGLFNKAFNMASFLFKNHILSRMDLLGDHLGTVNRIKKQFMGVADEDE